MSFREIVESMIRLQEKKNKDYGDSFKKTCDKYGLVAAMTRLNDKVNRIETIYNSGSISVATESFKDTLMDLAAYSLMTIEWMDDVDEKRKRYMRIKYFGAEHCGMCKALRPRVESWCKENNVEFEYCDADDDKYASELAEHGIRSIPAVVLIDGDKACTIRGIDGWNSFVESYNTNKNESKN